MTTILNPIHKLKNIRKKLKMASRTVRIKMRNLEFKKQQENVKSLTLTLFRLLPQRKRYSFYLFIYLLMLAFCYNNLDIKKEIVF